MRSRVHKYGAKPTTVDGIRFASLAESRRYSELKLLEKAGEIQDLQIQPRYPLYALNRVTRAEVKIGEYRADFQYAHKGGATGVVEDVKGVYTAVYLWKKRHFEAQYGVTITEIGRATKASKAKRVGQRAGATRRKSFAEKLA